MEKNKILMIVIIALLVVLLSAIGFLGFSLTKFMKGSGETANQPNVSASTDLTPGEVELVPLSKPINTNLRAGTDGKSHIASISISVGANNTDKKQSPVVIEMLTSKESIIRDICFNIIRNKTYEELKRQDGPEILRQDILTKLKEEFQSNLIYQVYISDMYLE